jgi:hydrogenase/urease accessory protein HupE
VASAVAHPLLQDAMQIDIARDHLSVRVTAAVEEVLVAALADGQGTAPWVDKVSDHGAYLLAHLFVEADGQRLIGKLAFPTAGQAFTAPSYRFDYRIGDIPHGAAAPGHIVVRQQALREIGLALGGPWEVTYVVAISQQGRPGVDARLLTAAEALTFECDWSRPPGAGPTPAGPRAALAWAYFRQGLAHILRGFDHLLFVAALVLAAVTLRDLIKVVVAFTLAHAITLTLCALRLLHVREAIVEPLIAASIVAVALQNLLAPASSRRAPRLVVAFLFGLLHGCGFASGALQAMRALPVAGIGLCVGAFSLGVEAGHQVVVIPTFMLLSRVRERVSPRGFARLQGYGSAAVAIAGAVYLWSALRL